MTAIVGAHETPYTRHPVVGTDTTGVLAAAVAGALADAGIAHGIVDGLGVASFSLVPDHAIDLAWRLGLRVRWLMDEANGGAGAVDMLQHAVRAIEAGDAETIVLCAGDHLDRVAFQRLVEEYNRATAEHLAPLGYAGPNALFAMVTQRWLTVRGLDRAVLGAIPVAQRAWAAGNTGAVYREPLTMDEYLASPFVAEPLTRYDCVPVVTGADAIVVTGAPAAGRGAAPAGARGGGRGATPPPPSFTSLYQPWAAEKAKTLGDKDDPSLRCIPTSFGTLNVSLFSVGAVGQIVQTPQFVVMLSETYHGFKIVPTDGRPHRDDVPPSYRGDSVGHWEGDTLVVDTTNFSDVPWMFAEGRVSFHSDELHIVERYRRVDANTLEIEATVQDPKVLTGPWTVPKQTLTLAPFDQIMDLNCSGLETQSLMDAAAKQNYGKK